MLRCDVFLPPKCPEMLLSSDKKLAVRNRWRAVAKFVQGKATEYFEIITRFQNREFARRGNAKQPAFDPDWRTEEVAADSFLIFAFPVCRINAGEDARVTPKPGPAIFGDAGRHVRRGFFQLVSKCGFAVGIGISGLDGDDIIAAAAASAGAKNDVASHNWRAHAALVEGLIVFPQNFTGIRVHRGDAVGLAIEDQCAFPVLRLI